jgi:FkbM family methyltransferase
LPEVTNHAQELDAGRHRRAESKVTVTNSAFAVIATLIRAFLQTVPSYAARKLVWNGIARPYVAWRPIRKSARAEFGSVFTLWLPDIIQRHIYFFGIWEPVITQYFNKTLEEGDIFIDIGANIGYHSLLASMRVGQQGKIYAIEASPMIFERLRQNISANTVTNVIPLNVAATDRRMTVPVYLHDDENIGATTIVADVAKRRHAVIETEVEGRPLGEIVPEADICNARLIKIDVEGAEWSVLQGFKDLIPQLSARTEILIEVSAVALSGAGASVEQLVSLFQSAGYSPFFVPNPYDTPEYYLRKNAVPIAPLSSFSFDQADILFRRPSSD